MSDSLQRRLLEREIELMSFFARGLAADLAGAATVHDRRILTRTLLSVALKLSRLIWPHGGRAGDALSVQEAAELRDALRLDDSHPLAPARTRLLTTALRMSDEELERAFDPELLALSVGDAQLSLDALAESIRAVREGVSHRSE